MIKNTLSTWNKNRLRFILILFFFALAIPTAILIKQAYSQLKWEAFHHYRLQAEELAARIDLNYQEIIEAESARTFTDYSFLNIAGNTKTQFLQRSPLSAFPVNSKFPGIIGYFQIDNHGEFTTPLLPTVAAEQLPDRQDYGISTDEKVERAKVHDQIYQILSQNKLVTKQVARLREKEITPALAEETYEPRLEWAGKLEPVDEVMADQSRPSSPATASIASTGISIQENPAKTVAPTVAPQAAFDKLQAPQESRSAEKYNTYRKSKGRVEDLKLEKQYQKKLLSQKIQQERSSLKNEKQTLSRRKETNVLPSFSTLDNEKKTHKKKKDKNLHVNMFESEIDAFEFSLLESGHFVLYRKVWRNGLRYIQGVLINPDLFINNIIAKSFYNTNVSNASNLTIAYQGNILSTLNRKASRSAYSSSLNSIDSSNSQISGELQGSLLLQNKLSATLDQLELIFSVNNLPAGPGGSVIAWLSFILLLILCGGFFALYVLGMKQIVLARQQQDFVSAVSHELKTPLTSIRMYGEMLREGWTTEEKRTQYYDYIYDESERLTRLINNVLQLARMTRNELPVDLKPYTIAELIDNTYSKINSQVERAEFTLKLDCDETIKEQQILSDADYFIQVIINLVDNAIKFSAKSDKKQIDIRCKTLRNNKIQFTIRDYGPGVNKDQLRKIFNLFYRSENELTRETVGTGIGLSLVKQLVNSMHGIIDVVNKDPGIEFQLTFTKI